MDTLSYKTISANKATVTKEWVIVDATDLDEVVVVAYGKAKRITLTGAVSGIQAREIRNVPTSLVSMV